MSLFNDIRKSLNNTGGWSSEQKRVLRAVVRAALGKDQVPEANKAASSFQSGAGLYKVSRSQVGDVIKTELYIDLTGLNSGGAGDVIGVNGSADSAAIFHFDADVCGTLFGGTLETLETPATGDDDIDLVISATGTTAEDAAPTTGTTLVNSGNLAAGDQYAFPVSGVAAKPYFYLVGATGGDATYTAGIVKITLLGT